MRLQIQYASPFGNCASIVSKEIISLCNKYIYKNSGIYSVTNKVNGHKYIGQSKNIYQRINSHKSLLRNGRHVYKNGEPSLLQRAWNKYGEDNFEFKVVQFCSPSKLNECEKYWINFYNTNRTNGGNGYNLNNGGAGQKHDCSSVNGRIVVNNGIVQKFIYPNELSKYENNGYRHGILEENRQKIISNKKILRGGNHPACGKSWTQEQRNHIMSGVHRAQEEGKYNWKRSKQSEETKKKRIDTLKSKPVNKNSLKALDLIAKNKRKSVVQLDMNLNYIAAYDGVNKAAEITGVSASGICQCCKGEQEYAKGYKWMYEDEYKKL